MAKVANRVSLTTHTDLTGSPDVCVLCDDVLPPLPNDEPPNRLSFGCPHYLCTRCDLVLREIEKRERLCPICKHPDPNLG
jgi:hypothetical protein